MITVFGFSWKSNIVRSKLRESIVASVSAIATLASPVNAQVIPDATLGTENSVVTPDIVRGVASDLISGGARRDSNLFHSFQRFNVPAFRGAYFENPAGVQNIFSRVTGSDRSEIFGRLGVLGNANLFFLNPNGILFSSTASLDVGGSFVATTANAIRFGDRGSFDATAPNVPSDLLTINPSALFFNQLSKGTIENRAIFPAGLNPTGANLFGLRVPDGQSLILVGGDINLTSGGLNAVDGHIELGGLANAGEVGLLFSDAINLIFPSNVDRANVNLSGGSFVTAQGRVGGSISIHARDVNIEQGVILTGVAPGLDALGSRSRDIDLNASGVVSIADSFVLNLINVNAVGRGGNINLVADQLSLSNSVVKTSTFGQGDAGNIEISANNIQVLGFNSLSGLPSGFFSNVQENAQGNGGQIDITTNTLSLSDGAQIQVLVASEIVTGGSFDSPGIVVAQAGRGKGGSVNIIATGTVEITSQEGSSFSSGITGSLGSGAEGNSGTLDIQARSFLLTRARIDFGTGTDSRTGERICCGVGDGGNINIRAEEIAIRESEVSTSVSSGTGNAGSILLTADRRMLLSSGTILARQSDLSEGNAGNITLKANSLLMEDSKIGTTSQADASEGRGNAGNITIDVDDSASINNSRLESRVGFGSAGRSGDINISTGSLFFTRSQIDSATRTGGISGNIKLDSNGAIVLDDSAITSGNLNGFEVGGRAGDTTINARSLQLINQSSIDASNNGGLDATRTVGGDVILNISEAIELLNSRILSQSIASDQEGNDRGGRILIDTKSLFLTDAAEISTSTQSEGSAGDIDISADLLFLNNDARITAGTSGQGNAGNIVIREAQQVFLASGSEISTNVDDEAIGRGGNISIDANSINVSDRARITARSQGIGEAGNIAINVRDRFQIANGEITTAAPFSSGGNVQINAASDRGLTILRNGDIRTNSRGNGGNITIGGTGFIAFNDSDIVASSNDAAGGSITFSTPAVFLEAFNRSTIQQGISQTAAGDISNGNSRVEVISTGRTQGGTVTLPDVSFIENSLSELQQTAIDPDTLIANSCIVRTQQGGTFLITGAEGLRDRPGDPFTSNYPLGSVRSLPEPVSSGQSYTFKHHSWQVGDPIVEPQGVYRLPNGRLIMSRECF